MNDENNELDAKSSKCWNCKYGICVSESEIEPVLQLGGMPPDSESLDIFEGTQFGENEETVIEHKRIKAICFWKPDGLATSPPIMVAKVEQCNRFVKK